jgi:ketosteroid isomerase-like protein
MWSTMATNHERAASLVRAVEASVTGDSSVVAELFTEDVCGWAPVVTVSSAAELAVELEDRAEAFSDVELDVSPLDVSGDRAAVEWVVTLTHSGPLEVRDVVIDPTGARVRLHGVTVAEFAGDRICSFRQYWDEAELLEQLALLREA